MFKKRTPTIWTELTDVSEIASVLEAEKSIIFKHSTRCSISSMALNRMQSMNTHNYKVYYLDLIRFREVSNKIAEESKVIHQSPQIIVFDKGKVRGHLSHNGINQANLDEIILN